MVQEAKLVAHNDRVLRYVLYREVLSSYIGNEKNWRDDHPMWDKEASQHGLTVYGGILNKKLKINIIIEL